MKKIISSIISLFSERNKDVTAKKAELRKEITDLKKQISPEQKQQEARAIFGKVETLPEFKSAENILLYWSTSDELPTHEIIEKWSNRKQIILPTVVGDKLILKPYMPGENMKKGALGIWEPDTADNFNGDIDLIIIPGIAFDSDKNRLGRGKAFYDRFLANKRLVKIGVGFDLQLLPRIPSEKSDIKMDKVITASHFIE
jgi:5-formyltetrahydrofolate cyclo-ligase